MSEEIDIPIQSVEIEDEKPTLPAAVTLYYGDNGHQEFWEAADGALGIFRNKVETHWQVFVGADFGSILTDIEMQAEAPEGTHYLIGGLSEREVADTIRRQYGTTVTFNGTKTWKSVEGNPSMSLVSVAPGEKIRLPVRRKRTSDRAENQFVDAMVEDLTRPIVRSPSPWADSVPDWIRERIIPDRLAQRMKGGDDGLATLSEVLYYLQPASQEAPLDYDYAEILLHVARENLRNRMPDVDSVDPFIGVELSEHQQRLLKELRRKLYEDSMKAFKKRSRS